MKKALLTLALLTLSFFASHGLAQRTYLGGTFSFGLNGGGTTFGVQFGANFNSTFGARGTLEFQTASVTGASATYFLLGGDGLYLIPTPGSPVTPYIGGGLALGFVTASAGSLSGSALLFNFRGNLGVEYRLNRQFALFGEAQPGFLIGSIAGLSTTVVQLRLGANIYF